MQLLTRVIYVLFLALAALAASPAQAATFVKNQLMTAPKRGLAKAMKSGPKGRNLSGVSSASSVSSVSSESSLSGEVALQGLQLLAEDVLASVESGPDSGDDSQGSDADSQGSDGSRRNLSSASESDSVSSGSESGEGELALLGDDLSVDSPPSVDSVSVESISVESVESAPSE